METGDIPVIVLQLRKQIRQRLNEDTAQAIFEDAVSQRVVTDAVIRPNLNEEKLRVAVQRVSYEQLNQVNRIRNLMGKPYDVIAQRADGGLCEINESHAAGCKSKE